MAASDEEALLQAVWAEPDDDAPRLVYADWLEENGQPERAQLIRVQCELARPGVAESRGRLLRPEQVRLLTLYRTHWLPDGCDPALPWYFHRGFVERLGHIGVFQSEPLADDFVEPYWEYVRFFPDGTVFTVDTPSGPADVLWEPHTSMGYHRIGKYRLIPGPDGVSVHFSTNQPSVTDSVTVRCSGSIRETQMALDFHIPETGGRGQHRYHWVKVPPRHPPRGYPA
jgi:uncharacterized protein (TIGR02996 family)